MITRQQGSNEVSETAADESVSPPEGGGLYKPGSIPQRAPEYAKLRAYVMEKYSKTLAYLAK